MKFISRFHRFELDWKSNKVFESILDLFKEYLYFLILNILKVHRTFTIPTKNPSTICHLLCHGDVDFLCGAIDLSTSVLLWPTWIPLKPYYSFDQWLSYISFMSCHTHHHLLKKQIFFLAYMHWWRDFFYESSSICS
jgi:hypothetical protein